MSCWHINEESHSHLDVNIQIFLLLEEWNHFQGIDHHMTQPLLKLQCHNYSIKNDSQNKMCTSWINNDYVYQNANTICYKHNIHWLSRWLKKWCQTKMCLFTQNMKLNIPSNGDEKISKYIICNNLLFPMSTTK